MRISRTSIGLAAAVTFAVAMSVAVNMAADAATRPRPAAATSVDLTDPHKKDIALRFLSSAESSSLGWRAR